MSTSIIIHETATENAVRRLKKMYENTHSTDVTFLFQQEKSIKEIKAHKCVLAAESKVFDRMFYGDLKENGDIKIVDVSPNAFGDFIRLIYLIDSSVNFDNLAEVVYLSHKYDATGCMEICMEIMNKNIGSSYMYQILAIANSHDFEELRRSCELYIMDNIVIAIKWIHFWNVVVIFYIKYCSTIIQKRDMILKNAD